MIDCERYWTILQKMQCKTSANVLEFWECLCLQHWEHLYSWETIIQKNCIPLKIQGQMFDTSEKLMVASSVNDEEVKSLSHAHVHVFSDSVFSLGKVNRNPSSNVVWEEQLSWFTSSSQCRSLDTESRWNSSGIFSQDSTRYSSSTKSTNS